MKAQRLLDALPLSSNQFSADALFDLTLLATGSQEEAEAAFKRRRRSELRSGTTPT